MNNKIYNTTEISELLGINDRQKVNYYIRKGYLKATMKESNYQINYDDYISFRKEYFDTNKRNETRGKNKKLSDTQISIFSLILQDIENQEISLKTFNDKYKDTEDLIIPLSHFSTYKRDRCIKYDYEQKISFNELSNKYNLAEITIREIINQNKESDFYLD